MLIRSVNEKVVQKTFESAISILVDSSSSLFVVKFQWTCANVVKVQLSCAALNHLLLLSFSFSSPIPLLIPKVDWHFGSNKISIFVFYPVTAVIPLQKASIPPFNLFNNVPRNLIFSSSVGASMLVNVFVEQFFELHISWMAQVGLAWSNCNIIETWAFNNEGYIFVHGNNAFFLSFILYNCSDIGPLMNASSLDPTAASDWKLVQRYSVTHQLIPSFSFCPYIMKRSKT